METYDILLICVLVVATLLGAWKGLAWQVAMVASLVASYFISLRFSEQLAPHLGQQAPWNRFLAMLLIYVGSSLVIWIGFRFVSAAIARVKLREFDRQLGAVLGAAHGVLLSVAITFFAVTLSENARQHVLHSRSGYYIAALLARADAVMPPELHEILDPYLEKLERGLDPRFERPMVEGNIDSPAAEQPAGPSPSGNAENDRPGRPTGAAAELPSGPIR